jgi:hypothetical protein
MTNACTATMNASMPTTHSAITMLDFAGGVLLATSIIAGGVSYFGSTFLLSDGVAPPPVIALADRLSAAAE